MDNDVIHAADLHKTYHAGEIEVHALRGMNLQVLRGEFLAIMGSSGSGKSTLMNILGCLDQATSGEYVLDGARIDTLDRNQLADIRNQKIGFVFQGFNLLPRTSALENVELPLLYDRVHGGVEATRRASEALTRVGLGDRIQHDPSQLSGGEQQRVAIARALVNKPSIILADEPTGNLDTRTSIDVMSVLQDLNDEGVTVLVVTHEPDIARYSRRIVELRDGRILRDEPVQERRRARVDLAAFAENAYETAEDADARE